MSPILDSIGSVKGFGWGTISGPNFSTTPSFESIATTTLNASTLNINFTSIPQTFKHLQIRCITRTVGTPSDRDSFYMKFNDDNGSNYSWHYLLGDGITKLAGSGTNSTQVLVGEQSANGYTSGIFAAFIIDILDYTSSNKYKTSRHFGGFDSNGGGNEKGAPAIRSSLWLSTSAISSITLYGGGGRNTVANSTFALYGIKGA